MNVFELIKEKLENATYWTKSTFDEDGYCNDDSEEVLDINMALDIVDEVAKEYNNGWIPCSERLPSDRDAVLVCATGKDEGVFISYYLEEENRWRYDIDEGEHYYVDVIAWQPLPAPYKEGGM